MVKAMKSFKSIPFLCLKSQEPGAKVTLLGSVIAKNTFCNLLESNLHFTKMMLRDHHNFLSSRVVVLSHGWLWFPGDMWQCLETFWLSQLKGRVLLTFSKLRAGMLLNILQHMTAPTRENYMSHNVNSAKVEKSGRRIFHQNSTKVIWISLNCKLF